MTIIKKNINQLVPRVIEFKNTLYIGFISKTFGLQELEKKSTRR